MTVTDFIAFTLAVTAASVIPGPAIIALSARTLSQGLSSGVVMGLGLVSGDVVYFVAAITGVSWAIGLMGEFVFVIRLAGAAYLVFLGWTFLPSSSSSHAFRNDFDCVAHSSRENWLRVYLSGLLVTLGNPKTMVFFLALLPALLDLRQVNWIAALIMSLALFVISFGALLTYGFFAHNARNLLRSEASVKRLNQGAGGILIGCGATIALRN